MTLSRKCPAEVRPRFLPASLIRARAVALDPYHCLDLDRCARQALYGVLAFLNARKPRDAVFCFRETLLPETLLGSRSALFRGLGVLETKGYIVRSQSRLKSRAEYGRYTRSTIHLQDKALLMLGLISADACPAVADGKEDARLETIEAWEAAREEWSDDETGWEAGVPPKEADVVEPAHTYPQGPCVMVGHRLQESEHPLKPQLSGQLLARACEPQAAVGVKDSENDIDPKTRLPKALVPLMTELGVSKPLICTLMAFARTQGQQGMLSTVVKLFWHNISGLRGRAVFAYLRKLLSHKRDFSRLLQLQAEDAKNGVIASGDKTRLAEKLQLVLARCAGWLVRKADGQTLGTLTVRGESGYVEGFDPQRGRVAIPANLRLMQAIEEGRLHLRAVAQ